LREASALGGLRKALQALANTAPAGETAETLARRFHDTYERLAPQYGYETREDTKAFDPATPNGRLMIAVCGEVLRCQVPAGEGEK
jgi:hypothetical protein